MTYENIQKLEAELLVEIEKIARLRQQMQGVIIGQHNMIERAIMALIAGGHLLLEGLPGLGKTLAVNALAQSVKTQFTRIQFTPDLLPADLVGTDIYDSKAETFIPRKGPLFSNIVLADEVNRAPAKVQSALLEVMQEKQITFGGTTYALEFPFLVIATQNPLEQEGTYPLPEAQIDRFMMKVRLDYPSFTEEVAILGVVSSFQHNPQVEPVLEVSDLRRLAGLREQIYVDEKIRHYIAALVHATRHPAEYNLESLAPLVDAGASPRASIALLICAQTAALLAGKGYISPQDVKAVAPDVLRHRLRLSYEADSHEMDADAIIAEILAAVPVP